MSVQSFWLDPNPDPSVQNFVEIINKFQQKSTEKKISINVNCLINLQNSLIRYRYFIYGFQCNIHYLKISIHIYGTVLLNPDPILTGAESDLGQTRNRSVLRDHILIQS
jgi:hypothetical protein